MRSISVNNSPDYKRLMGINSGPQTSRDAAATGGIVAIYVGPSP
jgi:hypothetical protein